MKATLLGATGLIGGNILDYLLEDEIYTSVKLIVRRDFENSHPKVKVVVIDFEDEKAFESAIEAESVIFCAIGTTQKKVNGNKTKYRKVDYDIPVKAARYGIAQSCSKYVLVSSIGANSKSSNFYTKLKGEVEDEITGLKYSSLLIFRPSLLLGDRKEKRFGERVAQILMPLFSFLLPSQYKPIQAKDVAKAMVNASKKKFSGKFIFKFKEIQELTKF
jgi:uncharacterized protein YbjT (DUF2867 family)